jgi:hypothetical protein
MKSNEQPPSKLRFAETPEEQQKWMQQWRSAEAALLEVKREELRAMTDEEAIFSFNALDLPPEMIYRAPDRLHSPGFIEQQRIFRKARGH